MQLLPLFRAIGDLGTNSTSFESLLSAACTAFDADYAVLSLKTSDEDSTYASEPPLSASLRSVIEAQLAGTSSTTIVDVSRSGDLGPLRDALSDEGIRALALVPLSDAGTPTGFLLLAFEMPHEFTSEENEALLATGRQLALALSHRRDRQTVQQRISRLEEQIARHRKAEQRLQDESELLKLLQEVAAISNRAKNFEEALPLAVERICAYTKWPIGHVFWLEERDSLQLVSSGIWHCSVNGEITNFRTSTSDMRIVPGDGWLGQVMQSGAGGWRALAEDENLVRLQHAEALGLVSSYTFPVSAGDRVFAVLEFFSSTSDEPSPRLVEAMDFVATQLAQVVTREETQAALLDSERRFRAIFNQTFQFIGLCHPDGTLLEANEALLVFGGVKREDVIGKSIWKSSWWSRSEETRLRLRQAIAEAAEGNFVRYEEELAGTDNLAAVVDFSLKPVFDSQDRVVLLIAEGREITRLKKALNRLERSETMLAEAQRVAQLGSWEWDVRTDHLTWSDELYRIYGVTRDDFTPNYENFLQLLHPDDRERVDQIVQRAYERQEPFDYYHRIVRHDGIVRTLHARGYTVVDNAGNTVRMYGTGQDVTDQEQIEQALRNSEESYRTLARNIPDAIVALYDRDLKLILAEGSIPPDAVSLLSPGTSLREILPETDGEDAVLPYYAALEGERQVFERQFSGGQTYLLQTVPVRDEEGHIFAGIAMAQNISGQKEVERKLIQRAQQLSALHEMGQTVAASLDLEVVFNRVLETLRPLLGAEGVFVLLCEGPETLVFAAANEVGVGNLTGQRVPASRGVAADVLRTGQLQWLHGDETMQRVYHELQEVAHYHPRAIIAAPMNLHGDLIGVMEAVHSQSDAFGEDERAMMETAASWVAIAIGNARQHGRLQHQLQESKALATISRALSQTLDLDRILQLIVDSARELMPRADWAIFYFLQEVKPRRLEPAAYSGVEPSSGSEKMPGAVSSTTEILTHNFLSPGRQSATPPGEGAELVTHTSENGALVAVPVRGREGLLGVLSVQSSSSDGFSADDQRLLGMLGRQAAMAIENARLFQAQEQARRTADTLRAANVALSQSLELPIVLDTLLEYARELIGFDYGIVFLSRRGGGLHLEAIHGLESEHIAPVVISSEEFSPIKRLFDGRKGLFLDQLPADAGKLLPEEIMSRASSWLLVPMLAHDTIAGVLVMARQRAKSYWPRHSILAEGLAAQAAVAVQNARLFAEVQSNQERLRVLSRQIVNAQEKERQRVSRELHDEAGQALTALKISLEMIKASWTDMPDFVGEQMGEAIEMTDHTMEQIRLLAHDLRPPVLDTFGLSTSVEGLVRDFGRRTGLEIDLKSEPLPDLPDAVAISFYRFVQETLTNVARHAAAKKVNIELLRDSGNITLSVKDDGRGFDVEEVLRASDKRSGIGLAGMQDRFELLRGWVEIDSRPEQGTMVRAYVPFEEGA